MEIRKNNQSRVLLADLLLTAPRAPQLMHTAVRFSVLLPTASSSSSSTEDLARRLLPRRPSVCPSVPTPAVPTPHHRGHRRTCPQQLLHGALILEPEWSGDDSDDDGNGDVVNLASHTMNSLLPSRTSCWPALRSASGFLLRPSPPSGGSLVFGGEFFTLFSFCFPFSGLKVPRVVNWGRSLQWGSGGSPRAPAR